MTFLEYIEGKKPVVTIDFDHTLRFETGKPNTTTISHYKSIVEGNNEDFNYLQDNDLYVVTSRYESDKNKKLIEQFLAGNGLKAKEIVFTNGKLKLDTLKEMGSVLHYEDDADDIKLIKSHNKHRPEQYIDVIDTFNEKAWKEYEDNDYDE